MKDVSEAEVLEESPLREEVKSDNSYYETLPDINDESSVIDPLPSIEMNPFYRPIVGEKEEVERIKSIASKRLNINKPNSQSNNHKQDVTDSPIDKSESDKDKPRQSDETKNPEQPPHDDLFDSLPQDDIPEAEFEDPLTSESEAPPQNGGVEGDHTHDIPDEVAGMNAKEISKFIADTFCFWVPKMAQGHSKFDISDIKSNVYRGRLPNDFVQLAEQINENIENGLVIDDNMKKYLIDSAIPYFKHLMSQGFNMHPGAGMLTAYGTVIFHIGSQAIKIKKQNESLIKQHFNGKFTMDNKNDSKKKGQG